MADAARTARGWARAACGERHGDAAITTPAAGDRARRAIERARGKHARVKMRMFAEVLEVEGYDGGGGVAEAARAALARLRSGAPMPARAAPSGSAAAGAGRAAPTAPPRCRSP